MRPPAQLLIAIEFSTASAPLQDACIELLNDLDTDRRIAG